MKIKELNKNLNIELNELATPLELYINNLR
jgi:hypothetical protein